MTSIRGAWVLLSFLICRRARKRREIRDLREWNRRKQLLLKTLDKEDRSDWLFAAALTILLLVLVGWYFYFLFQWAPYIWPSG